MKCFHTIRYNASHGNAALYRLQWNFVCPGTPEFNMISLSCNSLSIVTEILLSLSSVNWKEYHWGVNSSSVALGQSPAHRPHLLKYNVVREEPKMPVTHSEFFINFMVFTVSYLQGRK